MACFLCTKPQSCGAIQVTIIVKIFCSDGWFDDVTEQGFTDGIKPN